MLQETLFGAGRSLSRLSREVYQHGSSSNRATRLTTNSWHRTLASGALMSASKAMRLGAAGPYRAGGMVGGMAGGAYGAVSDDTSILGGAMKGAMYGMGGVGVARGAAGYGRRYRAARRSFGQGRFDAAVMAGRASTRHIGRTLTSKASNVRSSLEKTIEGLPATYGKASGAWI